MVTESGLVGSGPHTTASVPPPPPPPAVPCCRRPRKWGFGAGATPTTRGAATEELRRRLKGATWRGHPLAASVWSPGRTCDDAHRICCIPCGHVYGRSCLESWLHRCGDTSAKCPQCGKRFTLDHIMNLYAPTNLWGGCFPRQASVTSGISVFETELNKQILDMLREPAIIDIINHNVDMGNIYTTIDDFHYKLPYIDVYIQAPVTSGASGPETLNDQVLNILREPVSIEQEHGVHIDEIVKRFKLPKDAIVYNIDIGNAYETIDEFH
ncbi:hypothetical protein BS78_01G512600 [Paspalum vaginatum]|nr:hypothetical protein BS78_01G512600 [Paspalum vaginatum]